MLACGAAGASDHRTLKLTGTDLFLYRIIFLQNVAVLLAAAWLRCRDLCSENLCCATICGSQSVLDTIWWQTPRCNLAVRLTARRPVKA